MSYWCYNYISISGPKDEISSVWTGLKEATTKGSFLVDPDYGNMFLGNLLLYLGYTKDEVWSGRVRCHGTISSMRSLGDNVIWIETQTDESPMMHAFLLFLKKYGPSCEISYSSEDPVSIRFLTNIAERKYLMLAREWPDDAPEALKRIGRSYHGNEEYFQPLLEDALGHGGSFADLMREFQEKWGEYMNIHEYKYCPVEEICEKGGKDVASVRQ